MALPSPRIDLGIIGIVITTSISIVLFRVHGLGFDASSIGFCFL
jgi:hypothetical protein